jgi:hypothetical protein
VGQGFTVVPDSLSAGSQDIAGLFSACEENGSDAVAALVGMAGAAAGHAALEEALLGAAGQGAKTFLDMGAAYQHVSSSIEATASTSASTEGDIATRVGGIGASGAL